MNDQTIQMIAQAVIANTKVIQSLIDALPHEVNEKVAAIVAPAPAPAPAPVVAPAPLPAPTPIAPVAAPVVAAPVAPAAVSPSNMPAPPVFDAPAPAPVKPVAPFTDSKGLIDYVMSTYRILGPQKGAQIQNVLVGLGYQNINDIKPEHYGALFAGVEALK